MTDTQRLFLRVRQRAVRCYEITLFMLLGAMAMGVGFAMSAPGAEPEAAQCGNIQSSTVVMQR